MKYIKEINNILEFEAWSGGDDRLKDIEKYNLEYCVTNYLEVMGEDEHEIVDFEQKQNFLEHIYNGTVTKNIINYYTTSLGKTTLEALGAL